MAIDVLLKVRAPGRRLVRVFACLLLAAMGLLGLFSGSPTQEVTVIAPVVYVVPIEGVIDLGLVPFVQRVLDEAAATHASAVILDINTFGGRVDAAVQIRDALLNAPILTIAFVNKRAISAGALITLAAEKIAMADGGTIGAATPVQLGAPGTTAQAVDEKTVSYMRKEFRATAESRDRPPLLAEAMVDTDVAIPDIIEKGKLLTLTTDEALQHALADARANTLMELLQQVDLGDAEIRHAVANWAENVVRFLTHPIVSSLLITIGMLGIVLELRTPGFGIPGGLGIASVALFFWGHWLVQLAGWEEVLLVAAGIVLLVFEFFVIPGFGIAGVLGAAAIFAGFVMSLTGGGATAQFILAASGRVIVSLLFALLASLILLRLLPRLPVARRLILASALPADQGYASAPESDQRWLGRRGLASSPLRPAGIAQIDGVRVDVVSNGEMIDPGESIEVTHVDGNRIVVRRVTPTNVEE